MKLERLLVTLSDSEGSLDSPVAEFILSEILRSLCSLRMTAVKGSFRVIENEGLAMTSEVILTTPYNIG